MPRAVRKTDASQLSFPLQLVVLIVSIAISVSGSIWVSQSGLRSDVRDINTRFEMQVKAQAEQAELKAKLEEERTKRAEEQATAMQKSIDSLLRENRMTQETVQNMREAVAKLEQRK